MEIQDPTIGSDVEFFVQHRRRIVSAEGLIPGSKVEPFQFALDVSPYYATQLDNVLAEGNIPPCVSRVEFVSALQFLRQNIDRLLPDGYETVAVGAHEMSKRAVSTKHAKVFGCDPSEDAWTLTTVVPRPTPGLQLRSAGFHIHVGYTDPDFRTNLNLARAMDLFLGVPSVLLEPEESGRKRREVGYGQAGNFRHQRHGCEYRSLSSFFAGSEELIGWVYENTMLAIEAVNTGRSEEIATMGMAIRQAINESSTDVAKSLVAYAAIPVP